MQIHSPHDRLVGMAGELMQDTLEHGGTIEQARRHAFEELERQAPGPDVAPGHTYGWIVGATVVSILAAAIGTALLAFALGADGLVWFIAVGTIPFLLLSGWPTFSTIALRRADTVEITRAIDEAQRGLGVHPA